MPTELSWALYVLYLVSATVFLVLDNRSPQSTFAWLFLMVLAPGVGPVVYFFFGRGSNAFSHRKALRRQLGRTGLSRELEQVREAQEEARHELSDSDIEIYRRLPQLLWRSTEAPLTMGNQLDILQNASEKYPRLLEDLRQAQTADPPRILRVGRRCPDARGARDPARAHCRPASPCAPSTIRSAASRC